MILPIIAYGHPVLKKVCSEIESDYVELPKLIADMWETMYNAKGIGLAAPQIGLPIRLFLVDTIQLERDDEPGFKQVFINAEVLKEEGEFWAYEEGCLSIPKIVGDVERQEQITIRYQDENFKTHEKTFEGMDARVIQHEYDHIEGVLFTQKLKPLKRRLLGRKLDQLKKGKTSADYKLKFYNPK